MATMKLATAAAAAAALLAGSIGGAEALQIRVTYGTAVLTVGDNDGTGNDLDGTAGSIEYNTASSATDFNTLGGGGLGFTRLAVLGARCTICPRTLTLDVEATNATASEMLFVEVWDSGFTLDDGLAWLGEANFAAIPRNGEIEMSAYWSPSATPFATDFLIGSETYGATGGGDLFANFPSAVTQSPFGMTQVYRFNLAGQTQTMQAIGQTRLEAVPVPAALPLLAGALGLFGYLRARRRAA